MTDDTLGHLVAFVRDQVCTVSGHTILGTGGYGEDRTRIFHPDRWTSKAVKAQRERTTLAVLKAIEKAAKEGS
jgi:hypothetical protein